MIETTNTRRRQFLALSIAAALGSVLVTGAVAAPKGPTGFQTISVAQLLEMLQHKDFPLVNVHIPYEGEIAQTDAFIPFDEISDHLGELPADKAAPIVLYCRSGRMSEIAASELVDLGYTNVSHLAGGMVKWEKAGQQLIVGSQAE